MMLMINQRLINCRW